MIDIFRFLLNIAFTLFGAALIARAWMHAIRLHPFNPVAQAIQQASNWIVLPLRRLLPSQGLIDWPSLAAAWLAALVYLVLMWLVASGALVSLEMLPTLAGIALLTVVKWTLNLIIWLTLIQAILSWVNPLAPIMPFLTTVTAPLLAPIRKILPNFGGIDLSPLLLLILAQVAIMLLLPYTGH